MMNGHSKAGRYQVRKISRAAAPTKSFAESGSSTEEEPEERPKRKSKQTLVVKKVDEETVEESSGSNSENKSGNSSDGDGDSGSSSSSESESTEEEEAVPSRKLRGRDERKPVQRHAVSHQSDQRARTTRNRGQRTCNYDEDSDFDHFGDLETSQPSISSRGRVRKILPRARASLGMS
jgi:hypothetical protein